MKIPQIVHAEIVESVRRDHLKSTNRLQRRNLVFQRRANFRKLPKQVRQQIFSQLKEAS